MRLKLVGIPSPFRCVVVGKLASIAPCFRSHGREFTVA